MFCQKFAQQANTEMQHQEWSIGCVQAVIPCARKDSPAIPQHPIGSGQGSSHLGYRVSEQPREQD